MYDFNVESHKGTYNVTFTDNLDIPVEDNQHFIIDNTVAYLYEDKLKEVLDSKSVLFIDATEKNKSLDKFPSYVSHLVENGIRRGHALVAIGGGITQDITCFLAATMLRGLPWTFYPTTLLAQADSCIGSKSSINSASAKNILGTFTPPKKVFISVEFLKTLGKPEVKSGIGEMLKVHAIDGPEVFDGIAADYDHLFNDDRLMLHWICNSLLIKKDLIEIDEFDKGPRNVMNYGHSFGHAIEAATDFAIPHGIAVTIGMNMANYISASLDLSTKLVYNRMYDTLVKNFIPYNKIPIPFDKFMDAISKDKKNTSTQLKLILPDKEGKIGIHLVDNDNKFRYYCEKYLGEIRNI